MEENEVEAEQQMQPEEDEEAIQLREDIKKMFFLGDKETIKDISWNKIIDKFRDTLNNFKASMKPVIFRKVQDASHIEPYEIDIVDETTKMQEWIDVLINAAIHQKTGVKPLPELKALLERHLFIMNIYAQQTKTWKQLFHIVVEKTQTEPNASPPPTWQLMQEAIDGYRNEAKALISKVETRVKHLEEDFSRHKQCNIRYCHKGKHGSATPKEVPMPPSEIKEESINKHLKQMKGKAKKK